MNKNKKYILIALLASLLFTVTIGFSVWIILSEQARGAIQKMGTLTYTTGDDRYVGESWKGTATYTYTLDGAEKTYTVNGTYTVVLDDKSRGLNAKTTTITATPTTCNVTFQPESQFAQWVWGDTITATYTQIVLNTVAQLGTGNYYVTIDGALAAATSGEVYAIPSGDYQIETERSNVAKTIAQITSIPSGVTLALPYAINPDKSTGSPIIEYFSNNTYAFREIARNSSVKDPQYNTVGALATNNAYKTQETYCHNIVYVSSNLTLNGTLKVGGVIHSGINQAISGQTCGRHAQLRLVDNGSFTAASNSSTTCYGFIVGLDAPTSTIADSYERVLFDSGSSLLMPFVFYDWQSGQVIMMMLNVNKTYSTTQIGSIKTDIKTADFITSPILRYVFPNIVGKYTIKSGASASAFATANFASQDAQVTETVAVVSSVEGTFITLPSSASLKIHYDPSVSTDGVFGEMDLHFYGGATLNALSLNVDLSKLHSLAGTLGLSTISMTSKGKFLPLAYFYDVYFHGTEDGGTASYDLTGQKVALLPGSRVTIDREATVNASSLLLYEAAPKISPAAYAASSYPTKTAASITLNGILTINSTGALPGALAGGNITSSQAGGTLVINGACSTYDYNMYSYSSTSNDTAIGTDYTSGADKVKTYFYAEIDVLVASAKLGGYAYYQKYEDTLSLSAYNGGTYTTAGTYYSAQTAGANTEDTADDKYAWYSSKITLTLDAQNGTLPSGVSSPYAATVTTPSDGVVLSAFDQVVVPTRAYHTFSHWCTSSTCTNGSNCSTRPASLYGDTTLYAIWIAHQHNINWKVTIDGDVVEGEGGTLTAESFTIPNDTVASEVLTTPSITDRTEDGLQFIGWSLIPDGATSGFSFAKSYLANGTTKNANGVYERTVYAVWKSASYYPFFAFLNNHNPYGTTLTNSGDEVVGKYYPTNSEIIPAAILDYDTAFDKPYYFEGWYVKVDDGYVKYETTSTLADYADADGKVTLYANWAPKTYVLTLNPTTQEANVKYGVTGKSIYFNADSLTQDLLAKFDATTPTKWDTTTTVSHYFGGWSIASATAQNGDSYTGTHTETVNDQTYTFKQLTFDANWTPKYALTISGSSGGNKAISFNTTLYLLASQVNSSTLSSYDTEATKYDSDLGVNKYFLNWAYGSTSTSQLSTLNTSAFTNKTLTVTAKWGTKATVNIQFWDGTLSVVTSKNGSVLDSLPTLTEIGTATDYYFRPGDITVSYSDPKYTYEVIFRIDGKDTTSPYSGTIADAGTIKVYADSNPRSCFAEGTLITLADGTQKPVEELTGGEKLLVWNHYTGRFDTVDILSVIDHHGERSGVLINKLAFADGSFLEIIGDHVFYDVDLGCYVSINKHNVDDFIGHSFLKHSNDASTLETVELVGYSFESRITVVYQVYSQDHYVCFTNSILSAGLFFDNFLNAFAFDNDTFTYIEDQMKADIEKYGLYTYEDFKDYLPEEAFDAYNFKVLKVSVAKGLITWEEILEICKAFNEAGVEIN